MKYAWLFENIDVSKIDKEILDQYDDIKVLESNEYDSLVSFRRVETDEVVTTSFSDLRSEWREKQMELFLEDMIDRVADKVVEKIEEKKRQQETDYIAVLLQQCQPERVDCDELPEKGEREKMYCLNGEEWVWYNDKWVQIG